MNERLRRLDQCLAGEVIGTVLDCETDPRPHNETFYVRLSVPIVKILRTRRQDEACGRNKKGTRQNVHDCHIVRH
jgi:hypothetical protein